MVSRKWIIVLLGIVLLVWGAGTTFAASTFLEKIQIDQDAGLIDQETALLYKIYYGFDPDRLPPAYRPDTFKPLKNGTEIIWEYQAMRDRLSAQTIAQVESYLQPKTAAKASYISPLGYFQLSYDLVGVNAVSAADLDSNGIPDFVEKNAIYLDVSWVAEINLLGFTPPLISPYYQVAFENMAYYGYTTVVSGTATRIVLHNTFQGFPTNSDPEGNQWGAAKVTCAHEFKHASQRAQSNWSEGGWVELDATWAEDIVFDIVNDYYNYLPGGSSISNPTVALDNGGSGSYEDCIWQLWMSETWGTGIITDLWNHRAVNTSEAMLTSYDTILQSYGSSVATGFPTFAAWNFATGSHAVSGFGYQESVGYPTAPTTPINSYPSMQSGSIVNLAANLYYCTGFTGTPGTLDIDFNGQDGATMGLVAVIKTLTGTVVGDTIALDLNNDAIVSLSVPLDQIQSIGLAVSNAAFSGSATYTLTVDAVQIIPQPTAQLSVAALNMTLLPDSVSFALVDLQNTGELGSVLDYSILVMGNTPSPAAQALLAGQIPDNPNRGRDPHSRGQSLEIGPTFDNFRYIGDCQFGNTDTANIQRYYSNWWWGNESYAYFISPSASACACNPGFNVRAIHMLLHLTPLSTPQVRVHLAASTGGVCPTPGAILASSAAITVTGITSAGYYDIEVPSNFTCFDMTSDYFLVFEFLDAKGPVGIPIGMTANTCTNYNDWGSGYQDVVSGYNFQGDVFIWADVDCCGVAQPAVSVLAPNGGEALAIGATVDLSWAATILTDVKVELSRNGGGIWETLFASTINDGIESWTISGANSDSCLLRVSSLDNLYSDVSNTPFMIYTPVNWLTVIPGAGSLVRGQSQQLIFGFYAMGLLPGVHLSYAVLSHNGVTSPTILPIILTVSAASSGVEVPVRLEISGNAPNPFNPATWIRFTLPEASEAIVEIIDLQGHKVRTLFDGRLEAGPNELRWDGRDKHGRQAASGTYLVRVRSGGGSVTHKMLLAK